MQHFDKLFLRDDSIPVRILLSDHLLVNVFRMRAYSGHYSPTLISASVLGLPRLIITFINSSAEMTLNSMQCQRPVLQSPQPSHPSWLVSNTLKASSISSPSSSSALFLFIKITNSCEDDITSPVSGMIQFHLEVNSPRVVHIHLRYHLLQLFVARVLSHRPQNDSQLLEGNALVSINIKKVENSPQKNMFLCFILNSESPPLLNLCRVQVLIHFNEDKTYL